MQHERRGRSRADWICASWLFASALLLLIGCAGPASEDGSAGSSVAQAVVSSTKSGLTHAADELRTSWYPDQPDLSPLLVGSAAFGELFSTPIDGQVDAQPLVYRRTLLVASETNHVYGLDAGRGSVLWERWLGAPFAASDIGCADLAPWVGVTGTPVIDDATGTAYLFAKSYVGAAPGPALWQAHALDMATGAERPGFPVTIRGVAANDPAQVFQPRMQLQRAGLLLMNGVIYAAFGGHCDITPRTRVAAVAATCP